MSRDGGTDVGQTRWRVRVMGANLVLGPLMSLAEYDKPRHCIVDESVVNVGVRCGQFWGVDGQGVSLRELANFNYATTERQCPPDAPEGLLADGLSGPARTD